MLLCMQSDTSLCKLIWDTFICHQTHSIFFVPQRLVLYNLDPLKSIKLVLSGKISFENEVNISFRQKKWHTFFDVPLNESVTQELEGLTHSETELISDTPWYESAVFHYLAESFLFWLDVFSQEHLWGRGHQNQDGIFPPHPIPNIRHHQDLPLGGRNSHGNARYLLPPFPRKKSQILISADALFSHENKEVFRFYTKIWVDSMSLTFNGQDVIWLDFTSVTTASTLSTAARDSWDAGQKRITLFATKQEGFTSGHYP